MCVKQPFWHQTRRDLRNLTLSVVIIVIIDVILVSTRRDFIEKNAATDATATSTTATIASTIVVDSFVGCRFSGVSSCAFAAKAVFAAKAAFAAKADNANNADNADNAAVTAVWTFT